MIRRLICRIVGHDWSLWEPAPMMHGLTQWSTRHCKRCREREYALPKAQPLDILEAIRVEAERLRREYREGVGRPISSRATFIQKEETDDRDH